MVFTEEIGEDQTLNKGQTLELDVSVLAKPVPVTATWKMNGTVLAKRLVFDSSVDMLNYHKLIIIYQFNQLSCLPSLGGRSNA